MNEQQLTLAIDAFEKKIMSLEEKYKKKHKDDFVKEKMKRHINQKLKKEINWLIGKNISNRKLHKAKDKKKL